MATCPDGHSSVATDFCDVCGTSMGGGSAPVTSPDLISPVSAAPEAAGGPCPDCGTPKTGRFCENCGFDFSAPPPTMPPSGDPSASGPSGPALAQPPAATAETVVGAEVSIAGALAGETGSTGTAAAWTAVITADRAYYEAVIAQGGPDAASIAFPPYAPERRIRLTAEQVRVGRRSVSQGITPEIDLRHPPEDPGVSHLHAVLLAKPDGSWALVDPGSTNGTMVDPAGDPIEVNVEVPLGDGGRFYVGAWTAITLEAPDQSAVPPGEGTSG